MLLHTYSSPVSRVHINSRAEGMSNISTFHGKSTHWKSYWQQLEATIHTPKKLTDQLKMQYLLKSLTTKKPKKNEDDIQGIDIVAETYPEPTSYPLSYQREQR